MIIDVDVEIVVNDMIENVHRPDRLYIIPTDLYDQMMVIWDLRMAGKPWRAKAKRMIPRLYERRHELGMILIDPVTHAETHVGVR